MLMQDEIGRCVGGEQTDEKMREGYFFFFIFCDGIFDNVVRPRRHKDIKSYLANGRRL